MGLYFFSGKGGVGKTHLSTSFAMRQSSMGRRVLLVEFSKLAQYTEYFGKNVGFDPVQHSENMWLSSWTGLDCLMEYSGRILKSQKLVELFTKIPLLANLIEVAPGLKEIAILGKLTSDYRKSIFKTGFDDIIFDAPSSGHFISMLNVPESLSSSVGVGPMRIQCESILESLRAHPEVYFSIVQDGSTFSVEEASETKIKLKAVIKTKPVNIIENKSDQFPFYRAQNWLSAAEGAAKFWSAYKWK